MEHYQLALETGTTIADSGRPVTWAACPDLPGAYEEGANLRTTLTQLRLLVRQILAEHLERADPLDPAILSLPQLPATAPAATLLVTVTEADRTTARLAPQLVIDVPDP